MAQETHQREIGDCVYTVKMLPPTKAINLFTDLAHVAGPSLGIAVDGLGLKSLLGKDGNISIASLMELDIKPTVFADFARTLVTSLDAERVQRIIKLLRGASSVEFEGSKGAVPLKSDQFYENHFQGRLKALFGWIKFALEVQFSDFLDSSGGEGLPEFIASVSATAE